MSTFEPHGAELRVLPLGGCGEIGLNATLLLDGQDALLIDCGVMLGVPNAPGVDRAVPGFEALHESGRRLAGVVLTHGHEDHIGALPALLADFDVSVFGTALTIALAKAKLEGSRRRLPVAADAKRQSSRRLVPVPFGSKVSIGPFEVELIQVTHSLPESAALCIETRAGRVLHSGDFKLDEAPHDGRLTDVSRLKALGEAGVDLLLSDSTNSEVPGRVLPETAVGLEIERLIAEADARVVVACLASHLHRIQAIAHAARRNGRRIALIGRALHEMWRVGLQHGHICADGTLLVAEERVEAVPRRELVLITTGTQGESQAGLCRIASGRDPHLRCLPGDRVILSARTIPGNERAVRRIVNQLARQHVEVVTDRMQPVHCSGHACQGEQADLIRVVRPKYFVPVHGERAMLEAHAKTAREAGVPAERILVIEDGESVVLSGGRLSRGPSETVSRRGLDGEGRVLDWGDVKTRKRIGRSGLAVCSLVLDRRTGRLLDRPFVTFRGLTVPAQVLERVAEGVEVAVSAVSKDTYDVARLDDAATRAIRRGLRKRREHMPEIEVHVLGIDLAPGG